MSNRDYIEHLIEESNNKDELRGVFSDHFDNVTKPLSVSLGLYLEGNDVQDVVRALRENGIDAVPYYAPEVKDNLNCFVVDGTGIRTPILNPEDAIKATADMFEIMKQNNILTSRALPVSQENLIPAVCHNYDNKLIDISRNNPDEQQVEAFLSNQLRVAEENMEPVDFSDNRPGHLYRGGTLGDKPYALTFHRRRRDAAYAAKDFATAASYADGVKGAGVKYKKIDGKAYGFIYEFKEQQGQKYYSMAGIENPRGSEECIGRPENRDDYETLIIPDRNPLVAVYLKVDDKIVKIADEKGYISEDWEKFAHLHTPYNVNEKNDYMVERMNRQIADFKPVQYVKENSALDNVYDNYKPNVYGLAYRDSITENPNTDGVHKYDVQNAEIFSLKLPQETEQMRFSGDFFIENCSVERNTQSLNLENCSGRVGFSESTLTNPEQIKFPRKCKGFFLSDVRFPEGSTVDLSNIRCEEYFTLENQDFSKINLILPKGVTIKLKGSTKLPENMDFTGLTFMQRGKILTPQELNAQNVQNRLNEVRTKLQAKNTPAPQTNSNVVAGNRLSIGQMRQLQQRNEQNG